MINYSKGEVLLGDVPFSSGSGSKVRPLLVLFDSGDDDVIIARMTSQAPSASHDIAVQDWKLAGLYCPATIRLHKIYTIAKKRIHKRIGSLSANDRQSVATALNQMFGAW